MTESIRNFFVGLAAIVSISGLVALLFLLGELDALVHPRYRISIWTDHALGLRPGSRVELNGVPIGVVDTLAFGPNRVYPVQLELLIDADQLIPETAVPFAETSLLGASATLTLEPPPLTQDSPGVGSLPQDGTARIESPLRIRTIEQLTAELESRMRPFQERFDELSETYITLGRSLNELVSPTEDRPETGEKRANLSETIQNLNMTLVDIRAAMTKAEDWLGDEQLRVEARDATTKLNALLDDARSLVGRFDRLADSVEDDTQLLAQRMVPVIDELSVLVTDMRQVSRMVLEGQGTAAQLLNNPDLYNAMTESAEQLERTLQELDLLIEKLRAEGVKVGL